MMRLRGCKIGPQFLLKVLKVLVFTGNQYLKKSDWFLLASREAKWNSRKKFFMRIIFVNALV